MSDSEELKRLRADLESVNGIRVRYQSDIRLEEIRNDLFDKIAKLEAAADPWREAKKSIDHWRNCGMWPDITGLYDHLTAENARLENRVAEFRHGLACMVSIYGKIDERSEIAVKHARKLIECEGEEIDVSFDVKDIADMHPPFEGPVVGFDPVLDPAREPKQKTREEEQDDEIQRIWDDQKPTDPVLDPARVLATAVNVLGSLYKKKQSHEVWAILQNLDQDAKPYPLKKGGE